MPQYFPREIRALGDIPRGNIGGEPGVGDRTRSYRSTIHLDAPFTNSTANAAQILTTDTVLLARVPAGMRFIRGLITSTISLGTSTVAVGIVGTLGLYRTAAVFTAVDTPTLFGNALAMANTVLLADQDIILSVGVAALPNTAGARLIFDLQFGNA